MGGKDTVQDLTLVGDVGGTNCRLALAHRTVSGEIALNYVERFPVAEFNHFNDVVATYLLSLIHI